MKFRFLNVISDLLAATMNYLVVASVWAALNALAGEPDRPLLIVLIGLIPLFFYFVRVKVGGFFLFTIIHIAIPFAGYKLYPGELGGKIVFTLVLVALSVISYVVSIKCEEPGEPVITPLLAGGIMFGAIMFVGLVDDGRIIYIPKYALLFAALYMPYFYIEKFTWFDYINSKTVTNIPTMDSLKIGAPIVAGMSGFYAITAFVGLNETLMRGMTNSIREVLRKLLILFLTVRQGSNGGDMDLGGTYVEDNYTDWSYLDEDYAPSPIALFFEKIAIFVVITCLVALIIIGLILVIAKIVRKIKGRDRTRRVKVLNDAIETREKIEKKEKIKPLQALIAEGSYANRVRKLYRKIVVRHPELTSEPEKYTARTFSELFTTKLAKENAELFAKVYEKARYSETEVTKEDYLAARSFAAHLM